RLKEARLAVPASGYDFPVRTAQRCDKGIVDDQRGAGEVETGFSLRDQLVRFEFDLRGVEERRGQLTHCIRKLLGRQSSAHDSLKFEVFRTQFLRRIKCD